MNVRRNRVGRGMWAAGLLATTFATPAFAAAPRVHATASLDSAHVLRISGTISPSRPNLRVIGQLRSTTKHGATWSNVGPRTRPDRQGTFLVGAQLPATRSTAVVRIAVQRGRSTVATGSALTVSVPSAASSAVPPAGAAAAPSPSPFPSPTPSVPAPAPGTPQPVVASSLRAGESLAPGGSLSSPNHTVTLTMQTDGNLVLRKGSELAWASGTSDSGSSLTMQTDGNLVIANGASVRWSSATSEFAGSWLQVQDDGSAAVYNTGHAIWTAGGGYIGDTLTGGQQLAPGAYLKSTDRRFTLIMQGDGNLVLYQGDTALWSSGTSGSGLHADMQADGNLVVYGDGAKWNANTFDFPGSRLQVQSDGNLVIYQGSRPVWTWAGGYIGDTVPADTTLHAGDFAYSPNHTYFLTMQGDGNLVLYHRTSDGDVPTWSSGAYGAGAFAKIQADGNLVIYNDGGAKWNSNTAEFAGSFLRVQDDGNLVVYDGNRAIWARGSYLGDTAGAGTVFHSGDAMYSPNHTYLLVMQGDGNLVLYHRLGTSITATWSTGSGGAGAFAEMQSDGNFVLYNGPAKWNSGTSGHAGAFLRVQDDGNLVLYQNGVAIWTKDKAPGAPSGAAGSGQGVVNIAASMQGKPYCWAGGDINGPTHGSGDLGNGGCGAGVIGFDCTGLVIYVLHQAFGITGMPHSAGTGWARGGTQVSESQLQPGDVIFLGGSSLANFQHAAIYAGDGMMWSAPNFNVGVKLSNLRNWEQYSEHFTAAYRYG